MHPSSGRRATLPPSAATRHLRFSEEERAIIFQYAAAHPQWQWTVETNSERLPQLQRYSVSTINRLLPKLRTAEKSNLRTSLESSS